MGPSEDPRRSARSRNMRAIARRDTKPELIVRRHLHARGFRFRVDAAALPGRPDLVLRRWKAAIWIHGCFWHRHPSCRYAAFPKTNGPFWQEKFRQNVERDGRAEAAVSALGWRVAIVWECALRGPSRSATLIGLEDWIRSSGQSAYSSDLDAPPVEAPKS